MALKEYKRKRDFRRTAEPAGGGERGRKIFVVQLHHASHRHFDFRLEIDGVLKSWAVPKGPSFDPGVKRLAVEVEDHPIAYATFEGDIPQGHYGGGHVDVFDHGTWEPVGSARQGLAEGELKFVLHGDVMRGSWVLVRTRRQGSRQQWLLIKHADEFAGERDVNAFVDAKTDRPLSAAQRRNAWAPTPTTATLKPVKRKAAAIPAGATGETIDNEAFAPELCVPRSAPPAGDDWLHEVKWDGYRIVATVVGGTVRLWSRNAIEWTAKAPQLVRAIASLKLKSAQFDGEIVVLRGGRADFNALQERLSDGRGDPLVYMLFDLPHLNGRSLRDVPLIERKLALGALLKKARKASLRYSEYQVGHGKTVFAQAIAGGLEGIVSKRIDSGYHGTRNGDWVKVKHRRSDEFVVIGYTEPKGKRAGLGALLLARREAGRWHYAGRVGTGFSDALLGRLRRRLAPLVVEDAAAAVDRMTPRDRALAIWVRPELVVEAFYQGIGGHGLLRQAAFKALRDDKTPDDLVADATSATTPRGRSMVRKKAIPARPTTLTHADRVVFPASGVSKGDVAAYYGAVAPWLLPQIAGRPLSVLRCPDGAAQACFFQKHLATGWGEHVHGVAVRTKTRREQYLCIEDEAGLLELVQMNVLELHPWGARSNDQAHADRVVFDLDPHPSVKWPRMIAAARELHTQLASIGLRTFVRTSGGKGLHVVVPLRPAARWDRAKRFAQGVAEAMAALDPTAFVSVAGVKNRDGRIFIDWLRNARGATSIASYSLRARAGAGVAMPLAWEELGRVKSGDAFTIENAVRKIRRRKVDPWQDIDAVEQSLDALTERMA